MLMQNRHTLRLAEHLIVMWTYFGRIVDKGRFL